MKTTNTNNRKSRKLLLFSIIMLVILLVLGGWLFFRDQKNKEAIVTERAQYAQAEKELDTLSAQIIAKLGQPDDSKKVKECGYTSSKLGTGALFCNISSYLLYPTKDFNSAQATVFAAQTLGGVFSNLNTGDGLPSVASTSFKDSGLDCSNDFSIHDSTDNLENLGYTKLALINPGKSLLIELSCSAQHPKSAHFPIENS